MKFLFNPPHSFEDLGRNLEQLEESGLHWGFGTPQGVLTINGPGYYLRKDPPGALTHIYFTSDGVNWTGIV